MTVKKSKNGRESRKASSAQKKPETQEQMATSSTEEVSERLESAASSDTKMESARRTGALVGAARAIEDGVDLVGEKAPVVASMVVHKVKKGISVAYGTSSTFVREAYHAASDYAETYRHKIDIRKLKTKREALCSQLGSLIYTRVVIDEEPPEKFFRDGGISSLLRQIQQLDNEVVSIGKELEKD